MCPLWASNSNQCDYDMGLEVLELGRGESGSFKRHVLTALWVYHVAVADAAGCLHPRLSMGQLVMLFGVLDSR
jgi:hypothetical protein